MADFTSALYLGLRHPSAALAAWPALTSGRPAALEEPDGADDAAAALAHLQGLPAATLLPSTLHLFWDLLRQLARDAPSALLLDAGAYPILHWAAEGAAAAGATLQHFPHHDAVALEALAKKAADAGLRPVIVCDGYCTGCNRPAPLRAYARIAQARGGMLVLDDTQALGILGGAPSAAFPYGHGGGGSLQWHGIAGEHIAVGASLAKGYGAPLAVLSGSAALIARFRRDSDIRLHCSPPSVACVRAAHHALHAARIWGETWRARLLRLVKHLRRTLLRAGLAPVGRLPFPVQSFRTLAGFDAACLLRQLLAGGVRALLTRGCQGLAPRLSFIVTACHATGQIDRVGQLLAHSAAAVRAAGARGPCSPALVIA
jgi:8-amino-7-oxononanoate synthase